MAQFFKPHGIFVSNGEIFICDTSNHRVRKVLRNGQIVTIAGNGREGYNGDGQLATDAELNRPHTVFVSSSDQVYITDMNGHRIRRIDRNGILSTIAGTGECGYNGEGRLATSAQLNFPTGLFVTEDEQVLFVDRENYRLRKIGRNGIISTIGGKRMGKVVLSHCVMPSCVFQYKNEIYFADCGRIRKMDGNSKISTVAEKQDGNFIGNPYSMFIHNDTIYFSDYQIPQIRKILPNGMIKVIAGTKRKGHLGNDMPATQCELDSPREVFVDEDSQVYIADTHNHCIRKIDTNGIMTIVVGTAGQYGYSGDVPFDFQKYPHIGPRKKQLFKTIPNAYHDMIVKCVETDTFNQ